MHDWTPYGELGDLAATVYASLLRPDTGHPVFHGSWDWHSAVHGHWALLRLAHEVGDRQVLDELGERLCSSGMAQELEYLSANPNFELPYGRAWLLLLLRDLERCCGQHDLRGPGEQVAAGLLQWVESGHMDPNVGEYNNPCWVVLRLFDWWEHVGDQAACNLMAKMVSTSFQAQGLLPGQDHERPEFFSRWGLQALLIGRVLGAGALGSWVEAQVLDEPALMPIGSFETAHHLGMNASRAWAFAELSRTCGERRWRAAYQAHIDAALALQAIHRGDYRAFGHWVPQFIIYGWLAGEENLLNSPGPLA